MKPLIIYLLVIFSINCHAQTKVFEVSAGGLGMATGGYGYSGSIGAADDGTGNVDLMGYYGYRYLRKCDSTGNMVWFSTFNDSIQSDTVHNINDTITSYQTNYYSVVSNPGNGYAMVGETDSTITVKNSAGATIYQGGGRFINLSRISSSGNILWSKIFPTNYYTHPRIIYNSVSAKYLIYNNAAIVVLDSIGNIDFTMIFFSNPKYGCVATPDGNFLVRVKDNFDSFIFKIDTSGNILFSNSYSNGLMPYPEYGTIAEVNGHIVFTSDSNIVYCDSVGQVLWSLASNEHLVGLMSWHNAFLKVFIDKYYSSPWGNGWEHHRNFYTNTFDSNANLLSTCFSTSTSSYSYNSNSGYEVLKEISLNDNHILFSSNDTIRIQTLPAQFVSGTFNTLTQTDYNGYGCTTTSDSYTPIFTPSLFTNTPFSPSYSVDTTYSSRNYGIVNTFSTPTNAITCQGYVNVENMEKDQTFLSIAPNPANSFITISAPFFTSSILRLYDLTGRIVHQQNFNGNITLNIQSLNSSLYIIEINDGKGKITKQKLIKN